MIPDEIEKLKLAALNCPFFGADGHANKNLPALSLPGAAGI